jgi:hypothetical protein
MTEVLFNRPHTVEKSEKNVYKTCYNVQKEAEDKEYLRRTLEYPTAWTQIKPDAVAEFWHYTLPRRYREPRVSE